MRESKFLSDLLVLAALGAFPAASSAANRQFEAFLERLRQKEPARYEEIMRRWDTEKEVSGPLWGDDGREHFGVPVKGGPPGVTVYESVYTGHIVSEAKAIRERSAWRAVAPFIFVVGLLFAAAGVVSLCAPDFLWQWRRFTADIEGVQARRTPTWDAYQRFGGHFALYLGIGAAIYGLILMFS